MVEPQQDRILVVDDDPAIRRLVSKLLEQSDFEVDVASDGAQAIEMLEDEQYAVVVLDLMMPNVSGFDVMKRLKEHRPPYVKGLVVMSAIGRPLRKSDREQVCAIVTKPFDLTAVTEAVRGCFDRDPSGAPEE